MEIKNWNNILKQLNTKLKLLGLLLLIIGSLMFASLKLLPEKNTIIAFILLWVIFGIIAVAIYKNFNSLLDNSVIKDSNPNTKQIDIQQVVSSGKIPFSNSHKEKIRLALQADANIELDTVGIQEVLKRLEGKQNISVLDLGCGDGEITFSRFENINDFQKIVGVDINSNAIKCANLNNPNPNRFSFRTYDVEDNDLEDYVRKIDDYFTDGVDFVYSALLLSHLNKPEVLINKVHSILKPGGVALFRGSDDGTKICYPDEHGNLQNVIQLTKKLPGMSDRENARKLYMQLVNSRFKNIVSHYLVRDTVNLDLKEKDRFFTKSFSFRRRYAEDLIKEKKHVEDCENLISELNKFEELFMSDNFYYMEMSYLFLGTK